MTEDQKFIIIGAVVWSIAFSFLVGIKVAAVFLALVIYVSGDKLETSEIS